MPRMTPGITSGTSINSESAPCPGNLARSIRNAFAVPTTSDRAVTQQATTKLVQMLVSRSASLNSPVLPLCSLPRNQSSVKPCQGGAG